MQTQVLQVLEQLMRSGDLSLEAATAAAAARDLPQGCTARAFLRDLGEQLGRDPAPGEVIR